MHWNSSSSYWLKFHYTEIMFWVFWCLRSECPLWGTKTEISRTGWGKTFDMVSSHGSLLHICHIGPLTQDLQAFIHLLAVFNFSETFLSFCCLNLKIADFPLCTWTGIPVQIFQLNSASGVHSKKALPWPSLQNHCGKEAPTVAVPAFSWGRPGQQYRALGEKEQQWGPYLVILSLRGV